VSPNDYDLLRKLILQPFSQVLPVSLVDLVRHHFDHSDVVSFFALARIPDAFAGRAKIAGRAAEPIRQLREKPVEP
jgi:hypothetical protein